MGSHDLALKIDPCPLISVVVPVFNGEQFIEETVRHVLAQTYPAVELVVVDDGSADRTLEIVESVAPSARLIRQANQGVSAARNRGLQTATGKWVIFLDQDDLWHPMQLEKQARWMSAHPDCAAVVCPYHHWRPVQGQYPDPAGLWREEQDAGTDPDFTGWVYHQFLWDCWAQTSGTLLRRSALQAVGGYDETLAYSEDWDLWLRLSLQFPFATLRWPSVLYRHHEVQGSRTVRAQDFRTELLERYAAQHGLASRDGRRMDPARFRQILAGYHYSHGMLHMLHGQRGVSARSFLKAWKHQPTKPKLLALALAAAGGWRPRGG